MTYVMTAERQLEMFEEETEKEYPVLCPLCDRRPLEPGEDVCIHCWDGQEQHLTH